MIQPEALVTGANGEIGQALIRFLAEAGRFRITGLDLSEPSPYLRSHCAHFYRGNILDASLIEELKDRHQFHTIFHLAGLLSTSGERNPALAHEVNVDGSMNMFQVAKRHTVRSGQRTVFVFTSSIAAYGVRPTDDRQNPASERQFLTPVTMYGINKLYIEQLGRYYSDFYTSGDLDKLERIDFRCVRFPGLISPDTLPGGGTSDYGPEMLHAAAKGEPYPCFVRPDTRLPFMIMSDAVKALHGLSIAERARLRHHIYNVTSFSVSAKQIEEEIRTHFPDLAVDYRVNELRQAIVDSWPGDVDDSAARQDWDWDPDYGFREAFADVLAPKIKARYGAK